MKSAPLDTAALSTRMLLLDGDVTIRSETKYCALGYAWDYEYLNEQTEV